MVIVKVRLNVRVRGSRLMWGLGRWRSSRLIFSMWRSVRCRHRSRRQLENIAFNSLNLLRDERKFLFLLLENYVLSCDQDSNFRAGTTN
jgi:hypothetical protein